MWRAEQRRHRPGAGARRRPPRRGAGLSGDRPAAAAGTADLDLHGVSQHRRIGRQPGYGRVPRADPGGLRLFRRPAAARQPFADGQVHPVLRAGARSCPKSRAWPARPGTTCARRLCWRRSMTHRPSGWKCCALSAPPRCGRPRSWTTWVPTARDGVEKFLQENQAEYPACTRSGRDCAMKAKNRDVLHRRRQFTRCFTITTTAALSWPWRQPFWVPG